MDNLDPRELDLLERIGKKAELQPLFFRRVSGLKWFRPLDKAGYFDFSNIPRPEPAKRDGYVKIPPWYILQYIQKCAVEISEDTDDYYGERISKIIIDSTNFAKANNFGNYHVWSAFSEILYLLPSRFLSSGTIESIDYWLNDKYDTSLVSGEIGRNLIPKLLIEETSTSHVIALQICEVLFDPIFVTESRAGIDVTDAKLRLDAHDAKEIVKRIGDYLGRVVGRQGVTVFADKLTEIFCKLENDSWSSIWQPAIEDHKQNKYRDQAENTLLVGYRDAISGFVETDPEAASAYLDNVLDSKYETLVRVAIHAIGTHFDFFDNRLGKLLNVYFFEANFHHEMWHFLNRRYKMLVPGQRTGVLEIIRESKVLSDDGTIRESATAFARARWLAAIKDFGETELELYRDSVTKAGTEPQHPDFLSYTTLGWIGEVSPYEIVEMQSWSVPDLVEKLSSYVPSRGWNEPGRRGLANSLKQVVKSDPLKYADDIEEFFGLDLAYIHSVIAAYSELWGEKAQLPWSDIWSSVFGFILPLIKENDFWSVENAKQRDEFVANRHWVVGSIADLIEAGCKSDKNAFPQEFNDRAETVLATLLSREPAEEFSIDCDAVSIAINSPRGKCLEALINLTLRACRLEDKTTTGSHDSAWEHFRGYFDAELNRAKHKEYEFATLVTNYLPNFLYMSHEWVIYNLPRIFDRTDYLRWLCAMQGYSHVGTVYKRIYMYLKEHGDLLLALDDDNLDRRVEEQVVQQIVVAFVNDFESLDGDESVLKSLLDRNDIDELKHLVWTIWTLRNDDDELLKQKVFIIWPILLKKSDTRTSEGRRLISDLALWVVFVDKIDEKSDSILRAIAPFAEENYNSYHLLEGFARLSDQQPFEVNSIWQEMLAGTTSDYPEDAVRQILSNLVKKGREGVREAKYTASIYLSSGVERPVKILNEILEQPELFDF